MKRIVTLIVLLGLYGVSRADLLTEATARYGTVDTGFSTKRVWSPEVSVLERFGDSGAHALGVAYSRYQWNDHATFVWVVPAGSADMIYRSDASVHTQWDCFTARYEYALKITDALRLRVGPGIGAAWSRQTNDTTSLGGISGIMTTHYSAKSGARLLTEGRVALSMDVFPHGVASLGALYTHIESHGTRLVFTRAISTTQAIASLGFSF